MAKKARNIEKLPGKISDYLKDYQFDPSIFCPDSSRGRIIKKIVSELPDVDRIVFLLYVELGSLTEVAKILGVSRSTVFWEEKRIKKEILEKYHELVS